ncbi:glycosyltransferase family 2 protein [Lacticaseibacillus yichunensis]|uniref:Glycosyltransferase family 2 protein n=1 Tax=Lacticaseibacillus yichunensis TaxID=2486015 RepID=A0ABW4CRG5_9LACO|nr:glycosyltransferase family 2 protein [Lacticaseibacillus yichunensis]
MTQPLLSVIMPVYNAQKYLEAALDSLLAQDYLNFEALLIDDGSTDETPGILDAYATADARLQVSHVPNRGQAIARQVGLNQARGAYITFMDSDDMVLPNWLSTMQNAIGEADIAAVNHYAYWNPAARFSRPFHAPTFSATGDEMYRLWLEDKEMRGYLWDKLFAAHLFEPPLPVADFNLMEDAFLIGQLLPRVSRINFVDEPVYQYRINLGSTVHTGFKRSDLEAIHQLGAMYLQVAEAKPALTPIAVRKYASLSLFVLSKMNAAQLVHHWGYVQQLGRVLQEYRRVFADEVDAKEAAELENGPQATPSLRARLAAWSTLIGPPSPLEEEIAKEKQAEL